MKSLHGGCRDNVAFKMGAADWLLVVLPSLEWQRLTIAPLLRHLGDD
jgi:hypothetical protein